MARPDTAATFQDRLDAAWTGHAEQPQAVADRLAAAAPPLRRRAGTAFERFLCRAALALAPRAPGGRAGFEPARDDVRRLHAELPDDERCWCADDLTAGDMP